MSSQAPGLVIALAAISLALLALPVFSALFACEPQDLVAASMDMEVISAIALSFATATIATLLSLALGVPLAYVLSRSSRRIRSVAEALLAVPVLLPHSAAGVAILSVLRPGSPLHALLPLLMDTPLGIVVAQAFVSAPLLVLSARAAFDEVPSGLELAARSLGASKLRAFLWISLPLAKRGILAGALLTWARALSEFGAVVVLAYHPLTAPVLVFHRFLAWGLKGSQPVVALLIILTGAILSVLSALGIRPYGGLGHVGHRGA